MPESTIAESEAVSPGAAASTTTPTSASRRADARQNSERLLQVAAAAFARDGSAATLKDIAREAGVGIGTLYRHFPDRQSLVDAVYRSETTALCDAAPELLAAHPPLDALRRWAARFLDYMATKEGMAEALSAILSADEPLKLETRTRMARAVGLLIEAGRADGTLRRDLDADDALLVLGGLALIVDYQRVDAARTERLLDVVLSGLVAR